MENDLGFCGVFCFFSFFFWRGGGCGGLLENIWGGVTLDWVSFKGLKLNYYNGYIFIHMYSKKKLGFLYYGNLSPGSLGVSASNTCLRPAINTGDTKGPIRVNIRVSFVV